MLIRLMRKVSYTAVLDVRRLRLKEVHKRYLEGYELNKNVNVFGTTRFFTKLQEALIYNALRADVSKHRLEVYKSEKSKILKIIHKVALVKLLT